MANILTNIGTDIQLALGMSIKHARGLIPSIMINAGSETASVKNTVRSLVTEEGTINESATPSMNIPEGDDVTMTTDTMTLDKTVSVRIPFTGEDVKYIDTGVGYRTAYGDIFQRNINGMLNKIEAHCLLMAKQGASRAVGTAGTTPFASDFDLIADARQILFDNGIGMDEGLTTLVIKSAAGTNLRKQAQLQKTNEAGGSDLLRRGTLLDLQGFMLKETSQIVTHTKGTGSGYLLNDASSSVRDTTIAADTGTGTILAGDIVTFAGTTDNYVVNTALSGGSFTIGKPGLLAAETNDDAITVGADYTPNIAIHRNAMELAIRPMATPTSSAATDVESYTDPDTGITILVEVYGGYKKTMIDMTLVYGAKVWTSDGVAILMG